MNARINSWWLFLYLFLYCFIPFTGQTEDAKKTIQSITVVSDDHYPPYIFRDLNGNLQGVLVDEWKLWEEKTGIKVNLIAMDWNKAQEFLLNGKADVIDTLFNPKKRVKKYEFTKPYATIEVPVFFHKNLGGIVDIDSLQGFKIGVKAGDACIEVLKQKGITDLKEYNSYETIVKAAVNGRIKVFSMDKPPAFYYLYQMNFEDEFRYAFNLYTGEFHRAVKKGRTDTLKIVEDGFALINKKEYDAIEKKWLGEPFFRPAYLRYVLFSFLLAGLLFLILVFLNITLRKKVKSKTMQLQDTVKQLRVSEDKYRNIVENSLEGFFQSTPEGKFIEVNPAFARMIGYESPEDCISAFDDIASQYYVNPEDRLRQQQILQKYGKVENFEFKARRRDNSQIWISTNTVAVYDENGSMIRYEGHNINITDRKKSEQQFSELFNSITDLVYTQDMEGRFISANPAMHKFFGYNMDEFLGHKVTDFMEQERQPGFMTRYLEVVKKQGYHEGIGRYFNKNKERIYLEYKSALVKQDGKEPYISGIARNITQRVLSEKKVKKLQEQVAQAQRMESIGTLAGGIAHDFNNILVPILGFSQMLLDEAPHNSSLYNDLNEINTAALRAKELVRQILSFARQSHNEPILMQMQPLVKEALKMLRSTIPTTITIQEDIHPDCGALKADPTQIHQIVMNLATNAYQAMAETGGELKVTLKEIELGKNDLINQDMTPGTYVCLTVTDTGQGMDRELIQKIFDPFFTTKEVGKGTGMGLSVIHGIVIEMQGAIQVESEPGKGTQFYVYLPVEKSTTTQEAFNTKSLIQVGNERILFVDDEEHVIKMGKRMLEQFGYHVTTHTSSIEALEAFRDTPDKFDIVITDMTMPDMTGDELSLELIKIRPDIPILLCTGFSENTSEEKALSLGIKGFIFKPVVMKDFAQKIREVLDENRA